jgi:hypothetical protein
MHTRIVTSIKGRYFLDENGDQKCLKIPVDLQREIVEGTTYFALFDHNNVVVQIVPV